MLLYCVLVMIGLADVLSGMPIMPLLLNQGSAIISEELESPSLLATIPSRSNKNEVTPAARKPLPRLMPRNLGRPPRLRIHQPSFYYGFSVAGCICKKIRDVSQAVVHFSGSLEDPPTELLGTRSSTTYILFSGKGVLA